MICPWLQATAGAVIAAVIGGIVGWWGNYQVQNWLYQRMRRVDDLRQALYAYLRLASDYWHGTSMDLNERRMLEGRMLVAQDIIMIEYTLLAKDDTKMNTSYVGTQHERTRLWDATTGGCFQQVKWKTCPERVRNAASAVSKIVESFK